MIVELMLGLVVSGTQAPQQRVALSPPNVTTPPSTGRPQRPPISPTNAPQPSQVTIPICPSPQGGISASTGNSAGTASGPVSGTCSGGSLSGLGSSTVPH